jgi:hypothetical protein
MRRYCNKQRLRVGGQGGYLEGLDKLPENGSSVGLGDALEQLDPLQQVAVLGVLFDQTDNVASVDHLVHADDVGMLQLLDDEQLARQKAAHEVGARSAVDDLDGDGRVQALRPGALHVRVRPAADHVAQLDALAPQQVRHVQRRYTRHRHRQQLLARFSSFTHRPIARHPTLPLATTNCSLPANVAK